MHGRLKVRTSEEQQAKKHKEQQQKLTAYRLGFKQILVTRNPDKYDENSLILSSQLLTLNPDIYTLWNYRKEAILVESKKEIGDEETFIKFLENELKLTEQCLIANPKSYGSWHHRYWILNVHPKPDWQQEFNLCNKYLSKDDRNFHCWDHRRLIVNKIGITLTEEIKFSTDRINVNFSNYSSWHYRSTLLDLEGQLGGNELRLVESAVFTDPGDTSAWFYLNWVLTGAKVRDEDKKSLLANLEQLYELEPDCRWVLLAKCWLAGGGLFGDGGVYQELARLDPLRRGYYEDRLKNNKI